MISDYLQREKALDPICSFIVQAPAGSGKTELLTQRYLKLLSLVEQMPEQIIAITFTKKAASEMRTRIYNALTFAHNHPAPDLAHQRTTWELANKVLQRDREMNWSLLNNPNRLKIQTIDALCASLTRQMPILAKFGGDPNIVQDPTEIYQQTIQQFLLQLEEAVPWAEHISTLLQHLDNDIAKVKRLLMEMLQCRDQWLPHITLLPQQKNMRHILEQSLKNIVLDHLQKLHQAFNHCSASTLLPLLRFAATQLNENDKVNPLASCLDIQALPGAQLEEATVWLSIAHALLTKENQWRKSLTVQCGFPAPSSGKNKEEKACFALMKSSMTTTIQTLADNEALRILLTDLRDIPPPYFEEQQWNIVNALIHVLPLLAAQLLLIFRQQGKVDFIQMASSALTALGDDLNPTDLTLKLDYKIQHILIDEFQDTSQVQYQLIEKLTAGWQPNDGRTLFLVGDPMQSIYLFRQAEVGLFIKTWHHGLGHLKLEPLLLQTNFRSTPTLIDWINHTFTRMFPSQSDLATGAIHYSPSCAVPKNNVATGVKFYPMFTTVEKESDEAQHIVSIIQQERQKDEKCSIAILVKARSHLQQILLSLRLAKIPYQAIDIEKLFDKTVIQDLFALTRALLHPADKIAWLAILRAPWCGLTLHDLFALSNNSQKNTLWSQLQNGEKLKLLSEEGLQRLTTIVPILQHAMHLRARMPLSNWVEYTWIMLNGPACLNSETMLNDAQAYFKLLQSIDKNTALVSYHQIEEKLASLYAIPDTVAENPVQVMTIHKAKGLEFDTVIIPGLHQRSLNDSSSLMTWMEKTNLNQQSDLLIAPIKALEQEHDPIYRYIRKQQQSKDYYESMRLLYVAATRAKKNLYLLGNVALNETNQVKNPYPRTFLSLLWERINKEANEALANYLTQQNITTAVPEPTTAYPLLQNVPVEELIAKTRLIDRQNITLNRNNHLLFATDNTQRHIGIVVHKLLKEIVLQQWHLHHIISAKQIIRHLLLLQNVSIEKLPSAIMQVIEALTNVFADERGRWIINAHHQDSRAEHALTTCIGEEIKHLIIDRTFVDENNVRWIIDYKTATPDNMPHAQFLADELDRYKPQLENYAFALAKYDPRPICMGLYFPLCTSWIEWKFNHPDTAK